MPLSSLEIMFTLGAQITNGVAELHFFQFTEKLIRAWFPAAGDDSEKREGKVLLAKLDIAKCAFSALKEKNSCSIVYKRDGFEAASFDAALASAVRAWVRYLQVIDSAKELRQSELTNVDFSNFVPADDRGLLDMWASAVSFHRGKVAAAIESMKATMEPGATWKDGAESDMSIEQIISMAETTLMQIKGKKLTSQKDTLSQAGHGRDVFSSAQPVRDAFLGSVISRLFSYVISLTSWFYRIFLLWVLSYRSYRSYQLYLSYHLTSDFLKLTMTMTK